MELYLDTADTRAIRELSQTLTVAGVTTNPSIVAKAGGDPYATIKAVADALTPEQRLFVQTIATTASGMVEDAERICALREKTVVKIPATPEGLRAIKACKQRGLTVLATTIYSADQGFMAALNGADYLAPYVNRMCEFGDGVAQVADLVDLLDLHELSSKVVAASFKSVNQVHEVLLAGVHAVTVPVDVMRQFMGHPACEGAVAAFTHAWESVGGGASFKSVG